MQRHCHQEFLRFLDTVECAIPAGKLVDAILDKSTGRNPSIPTCEAVAGSKPATGATHKHPKVKAWLARHPRWTFHFTPASGSWLNAVETFFSAIDRKEAIDPNPEVARVETREGTRRRIRRGVFHSVDDLKAAIARYLAEQNANPKPFTWTATCADIIDKMHPLNESAH